MPKIVSLSIIHYGVSYLPYALQSVLPFVEKAGIFYSSNPSHGTQLTIPPIETRKEIETCLPNDNKIDFVETSGFKHEGQHRDFSQYYLEVTYKPDYIIVLDYDEVWPKETLTNVIEWLENLNEDEKRHQWLLNFTHFYRSWNEVCKDNMWPIRVIDCNTDEGIGYLPQELGDIYHFGYAIEDKVLNYKIRCHGHIAEWRKNWLKDKWYNYQSGITKDVHPTCEDTWNPQPFNKMKLPDFMHLHSYFGLEKI